jgi:GTP-binding protein
MKPLVAIVGRPNVGKSTLFNRISRRKKAIVGDQPGVTRDRSYIDTSYNDKDFTLIDTGGFEPTSEKKLSVQMREQVQLAIEEADLIIFILDGKEGMTSDDIEFAGILRKVAKPVFYVVNKIDGPKQEANVHDFYRFGESQLYSVSAQHGRGVGDLMDKIVESLPPPVCEDYDEETIKMAIVGRPNVGKSSLVNKILGHERVIVNELPGTTRDSIDTPFSSNGKNYLLIDTAGIRRKGRVSLQIDTYSIVEALRTMDRCDVALIMIDAFDGVTSQDSRIAGYVHEKGKAPIIVVNKWDLIEKDDSTTGRYTKFIKSKLKYLDYAPIIFISALTGQRVSRILTLVFQAVTQTRCRVSTPELNNTLRASIENYPPSFHRENR